MTSDELEYIAKCDHRSACARLVTLHGSGIEDDYYWCGCVKCPYYSTKITDLQEILAEVLKMLDKAESDKSHRWLWIAAYELGASKHLNKKVN